MRNSNSGGSAGGRAPAHVQLGKLFIGGLSFETTDEKLQTYFSQFGPVTSAVVMRDTMTKRSRGFGFVSFKENDGAEKAMQCPVHEIDKRRVEAKWAVPREHIQPRNPHPPAATALASRPTPERSSRSSGKKIFVGGLHYDTSDTTLREYFSTFGKVDSVQVMYNRETNKSRGFGFVTFEADSSVDKVLKEKRMHEIDQKSVEVKRAVPKSEAPPPRAATTGHSSSGYAGSNTQHRRKAPARNSAVEQQQQQQHQQQPQQQQQQQPQQQAGRNYPSYAKAHRPAAGRTVTAPPAQNPWNRRNHSQNFKHFSSKQQAAQAAAAPSGNSRRQPAAAQRPRSRKKALTRKKASVRSKPSSRTPATIQPIPVAAAPKQSDAEALSPNNPPRMPPAVPAEGFDVDSFASVGVNNGPSVADEPSTERLIRSPAALGVRSPHRTGQPRSSSMFGFALSRAGSPTDDGSDGRRVLSFRGGSSDAPRLAHQQEPSAGADIGLPQQQQQPHQQQLQQQHPHMMHPHMQQHPHMMHPHGYAPHMYGGHKQRFVPSQSQPVGAEEDFTASQLEHLHITPRMDPPPHMPPMMGRGMHNPMGASQYYRQPAQYGFEGMRMEHHQPQQPPFYERGDARFDYGGYNSMPFPHGYEHGGPQPVPAMPRQHGMDRHQHPPQRGMRQQQHAQIPPQHQHQQPEQTQPGQQLPPQGQPPANV